MLERIKQILLTQYIGAIIVAFIGVQGILGVLGVFMQPVFWMLTGQRRTSVFVAPERPAFDWNVLLASTVNAALHLLVAYLLFRWLYMQERPAESADVEPVVE